LFLAVAVEQLPEGRLDLGVRFLRRTAQPLGEQVVITVGGIGARPVGGMRRGRQGGEQNDSANIGNESPAAEHDDDPSCRMDSVLSGEGWVCQWGWSGQFL